MRFMIMHETNAHWEAGAIPSSELIARVGKLLGQLAKAGDPSEPKVSARARMVRGSQSRRARAPSSKGRSRVATSCLPPSALSAWVHSRKPPSGLRVRQARSVTLKLTFGPSPNHGTSALRRDRRIVDTRRYMVLRKATAETESGAKPSSAQRSALTRVVEETTITGVHVVAETMRPSSKGRRYKNSRDGVTVSDGPFTESKELIPAATSLCRRSLSRPPAMGSAVHRRRRSRRGGRAGSWCDRFRNKPTFMRRLST